jgi:hypothetical protein
LTAHISLSQFYPFGCATWLSRAQRKRLFFKNKPSRCDTIKPISDFKPRPGTFLPYLEAENKCDEQRTKASPLTLLEILARQSRQSLPIFELQGQSGMEPARYGEALKSLLNAGYIMVEGEVPEQVVRLTERGAEVVRLPKLAQSS